MDVLKLIQTIISDNRKFLEKHCVNDFKIISKGQNPDITLVTCSDSRVQNSFFSKDSINKIFVVRNLGNQVTTNLGAVEYGILHLKTPILLIVGHSDCGAVKAFFADYSNEPDGIKSELDNFNQVYKGKNDDSLVENIIKNIDYQVSFSIKRFEKKVNSGELLVIGAYCDFSNDLNRCAGKLNILNINGKKNKNDLLLTDFKNKNKLANLFDK
jgi:carbonic anhydrase